MVTVVVVHVPILVIPVSSLDHLVHAVHQVDVVHLQRLQVVHHILKDPIIHVHAKETPVRGSVRKDSLVS